MHLQPGRLIRLPRFRAPRRLIVAPIAYPVNLRAASHSLIKSCRVSPGASHPIPGTALIILPAPSSTGASCTAAKQRQKSQRERGPLTSPPTAGPGLPVFPSPAGLSLWSLAESFKQPPLSTPHILSLTLTLSTFSSSRSLSPSIDIHLASDHQGYYIHPPVRSHRLCSHLAHLPCITLACT